MMQQFEAAKARCPGALVLFRMGDFYELFGDDAREAAELLDLTVTSREKGPDAMPMAGFPHHQLDPQLVKLVAAGRRVAICEQIDDPKTTKGLLRREVTRIVTPGIAADESLLDPTRSNFLVAVIPVETGQEPRASPASPSSDSPQAAAAGIAWIDVAGGRFQAAVLPPADLAEQRSTRRAVAASNRDHRGAMVVFDGATAIAVAFKDQSQSGADRCACRQAFQSSKSVGLGRDQVAIAHVAFDRRDEMAFGFAIQSTA